MRYISIIDFNDNRTLEKSEAVSNVVLCSRLPRPITPRCTFHIIIIWEKVNRMCKFNQ